MNSPKFQKYPTNLLTAANTNGGFQCSDVVFLLSLPCPSRYGKRTDSRVVVPGIHECWNNDGPILPGTTGDGGGVGGVDRYCFGI